MQKIKFDNKKIFDILKKNFYLKSNKILRNWLQIDKKTFKKLYKNKIELSRHLVLDIIDRTDHKTALEITKILGL